jgi:ferredoxin
LRWLIDQRVFGGLLGGLGRTLLRGHADWLLGRLPIHQPWTRRVRRPPHGSWPMFVRPIPPTLLTQPGIMRNPDAEDAAFAADPLRSFPEDATIWGLSLNWRVLLAFLPAFARERWAFARTLAANPAPRPTPDDPDALTTAFFAEAARIGLSAVGVAAYDRRYQYEEYRGTERGDRMVIGLLEEDHMSVQALPNPAGLKTTFATIGVVNEMMLDLAAWLHARGYQAYVAENMGAVIPYAVAAGLGQLGLNGQLLTPNAGSRCRPSMLSTNAPLRFGQPKDFGIPAICDACRICVQRCPSGAIPARRFEHRGVVKAKINTARCLPLVAQAYGCAVCMRVCPVQRYGLDAVLEEFERSGTIKGKGTAELEAYNWPVDGRTYGPGKTPLITREFVEPRGLTYRPEYNKPADA